MTALVIISVQEDHSPVDPGNSAPSSGACNIQTSTGAEMKKRAEVVIPKLDSPEQPENEEQNPLVFCGLPVLLKLQTLPVFVLFVCPPSTP